MLHKPDPQRECVRCHAKVFYAGPEHLCDDLARRLKRRQKQVQAVLNIMEDESLPDIEAAEAIVAVLANMGVADD